MEKDQPITVTADAHLKAGYAWEVINHLDEMVIMSGEHSSALVYGVDVFDNCLCERHSIIGGGPPAHLVKHNQAVGGRLMDNRGNLGHLDQKRAASACDVFGCADASEDTIAQPEGHRLGRHKRSHLCQHDT